MTHAASVLFDSTMPFPESDRVVYDNNPLAQVVAQIRFPTILSIAATDPADFQQHIRTAYPIYSKQPALLLPEPIGGLMQSLIVPAQVGPIKHVFSSADGTRSASLATDFLALEETNYVRWERFRDEIQILIDALEETYQPAFYSRIGLRYIDVIDPHKLDIAPSDDWASLIKPPLLGLLAEPELSRHVRDNVSISTLSIPDVRGAALRLQHGVRVLPGTERRVYVIDVDLFTEERTSARDVADTLGVFNHIAGNFFRWAITDRLSRALKPQPLATTSAGASVRHR